MVKLFSFKSSKLIFVLHKLLNDNLPPWYQLKLNSEYAY